MAMTETRFYTVEQAAQALQVRQPTLRGWLRRGIVRGAKLGPVWRIPETELERIRTGAK